MINLNIALNILGGAEYLILILIIAVLAIPFLYLATLFNTIKLANRNKRTISPWSVWLAFIPIVGIFLHYNHINRINETLEEEFKDRGIKQHDSQFGFTAGKTYSTINIILFFANIVYSIYYWVSIYNINERSYNQYTNSNEEYAQFLNSSETKLFGVLFIVASIIAFICWIIYWSKMANCKRILLNHNSQTYQSNNSFNQKASNVLNSLSQSVSKENSLKQNAANVWAASSKLLNNKSNDYQNTQINNQTKKCQDCATDMGINDNFCMKCGFDYTKLPPVQITKLNENEKECPECKLILNKDASNCTNCGFPFSVDEITAHHSYSQNKTNVLDAIENVKMPSSVVQSNKVQSNQITNESKSTIEVKKNSSKIYFIVLGILLLLIGAFATYKIVFTEPTAEQRAKQEEMAKLMADSVSAALEASLAIDMEAEKNIANVNATSSEAPINNPEINEDNTNIIWLTVVSKKAYFYNEPNISTKTNSFIIKGDAVEFLEDAQEFTKVTFKNSQGNKTEGWILKSDFDNNTPSIVTPQESSNEETFTAVEEMPEFIGGQQEMMNFISQNLQYPQSAKEAGLSGKCFLKFVVNGSGRITDVIILKGVPGCQDCDREAVRVVKSMPNWKPGKQHGKPVSVFFNLPINFKLRE